MKRISHRELRNNSSEVLRAVDGGESFEITNYGRTVALIVPAPEDPLESLRRAGKTVGPTRDWPVVLDSKPIPVDVDSASILDELRGDR